MVDVFSVDRELTLCKRPFSSLGALGRPRLFRFWPVVGSISSNGTGDGRNRTGDLLRREQESRVSSRLLLEYLPTSRNNWSYSALIESGQQGARGVLDERYACVGSVANPAVGCVGFFESWV